MATVNFSKTETFDYLHVLKVKMLQNVLNFKKKSGALQEKMLLVKTLALIKDY